MCPLRLGLCCGGIACTSERPSKPVVVDGSSTLVRFRRWSPSTRALVAEKRRGAQNRGHQRGVVRTASCDAERDGGHGRCHVNLHATGGRRGRVDGRRKTDAAATCRTYKGSVTAGTPTSRTSIPGRALSQSGGSARSREPRPYCGKERRLRRLDDAPPRPCSRRPAIPIGTAGVASNLPRRLGSRSAPVTPGAYRLLRFVSRPR
jgi:hypothetical protein